MKFIIYIMLIISTLTGCVANNVALESQLISQQGKNNKLVDYYKCQRSEDLIKIPRFKVSDSATTEDEITTAYHGYIIKLITFIKARRDGCKLDQNFL